MLHPQARALLDLIEKSGLPPIHTLTPEDARKVYRERRSFSQPAAPDVAKVQDLQATGPHGAIPLRLYVPKTNADPAGSQSASGQALLPVLVYYHGGGWVIGDLDTHDTLCRELANLSGCAVVAVDYRMGPEQPFPAAVDDCWAATRWVQANAASLGLDATRLAVGGDSAGGNLAAVMTIMARDHADGVELPIRFQLLIYPGTDQRRGHASHTSNGQGYALTSDTIAYFQNHYIADKAQFHDWRASPLLAESLAKLPPALVITAGFDPLRDEGLDYADRLSAAGTSCHHVCFARQIHGFITMGRVLEEANAAVRLCASELKQAIALIQHV